METPEFQAVSPRTKIPVFQDRDLKLFESCAIVTYLANAIVTIAGSADRFRRSCAL